MRLDAAKMLSLLFQRKNRLFVFACFNIAMAIVLLGNALNGSLRLTPLAPQSHRQLFPYDNSISQKIDDPYLETMMSDTRLIRSAQQQLKFLTRRRAINDTMRLFFTPEYIYPTWNTWWAAFVVNADWAYIHVWKSGGTTIEDQTKEPQTSVTDERIQNRTQWLVFVRDPIDHFLSGYSECIFRKYENLRVKMLPRWNPDDYDEKIRVWLQEVKEYTMIEKIDCHIHSFPQINFLIDPKTRKIYPKIKAVGEMTELPAFLERIAKFPYNYTQGSSRVAKENHVKMNYFPSRQDLLSNETLRDICHFVSLDYYFFDYQPPDVCKDVLVTPQKQPQSALEPERPQPLHAGEHYQMPKAKVAQSSTNLQALLPAQAKHRATKLRRENERLEQKKLRLQQFKEQHEPGYKEQQLARQQQLLEERLQRVKEEREQLQKQQK